jgi:hypothetical protein
MSRGPPPWLQRLNGKLSFGPRPKGPDDLTYLVQHMGLHCFINASPLENGTERDAYRREFGEHFDFFMLSAPLPPLALKSAPQLLTAVRSIQKRLLDAGKTGCYVHAENGLYEEAYIGLLLWRLMYPAEAPANVAAWLKESNKELLFDDDEDKRALLVDCWTLLDAEQAKQQKMSIFGKPIKRAKK